MNDALYSVLKHLNTTHYLFHGRGTRYPNINTLFVRVTYCLIITGYSSQHQVRGGGGVDEGTLGWGKHIKVDKSLHGWGKHVLIGADLRLCYTCYTDLKRSFPRNIFVAVFISVGYTCGIDYDGINTVFTTLWKVYRCLYLFWFQIKSSDH